MFAHSRKAYIDLAHTIEIAVTQTQKWINCAESDGVVMNALSPRRLPLSVCINSGQDISFLHACKQPGNEASCRYELTTCTPGESWTWGIILPVLHCSAQSAAAVLEDEVLLSIA